MARSILIRRARVFFRQIKRFIFIQVLHANDPPQKLAIGASVGIFVMFTPTIGIQMVAAGLLAWLLRGNKAVAAAIVWISNPLTFVPIFYPCYRLGVFLTGHQAVGAEWWEELREPPAGTWLETLRYYWDRIMEVAAPMWVGCLILATLFALTTYLVVYRVVLRYRMRRWGQEVPPIRSPHRLKHYHQETSS